MRLLTLATFFVALTACGGSKDEGEDTTLVISTSETGDTGNYQGPTCTTLDNFSLVWTLGYDQDLNEVVDFSLDGTATNSTVTIYWLENQSTVNCITVYDASDFALEDGTTGDATSFTGTLSSSGAQSDCDLVAICAESFGPAADPIASLAGTEWTMTMQETVPVALEPYAYLFGETDEVFGGVATSPNVTGELDYIFVGYEFDASTMDADTGALLPAASSIDSLGLKTGVYFGQSAAILAF